MKRIIKLSLLMLALLLPTTVSAMFEVGTFTVGIFTFAPENSTNVSLLKCNNDVPGNIDIPQSVEYNGITYTVTGIRGSAFDNCTSMTGVTIPNTICWIGSGAFSFKQRLTSVYITDLAAWCKINFESFSANPLRIAHHLYLNGDELTHIDFPNTVTAISNYAFYGCDGLISVNIGNSVNIIGDNAFRDCTGLTSVSIGNSVTEIGYSAFSDCTALTSVIIGNSVNIIGKNAFVSCTSLTNVIIPNSVSLIGRCAFWCCTNLANIVIPNSVTLIDELAFDGTAWLNNQPDGLVYAGLVAYKYKGEMPNGTSINIIEGTLGIACSAFYNRSELISVTIPNTVTTIAGGAFIGCTGLTSINIPSSVSTIGSSYSHFSRDNNPFLNCSGLKFISVDSGNPYYDSRNYCNAIIETKTNTLLSGCQNTIIPNSVSSIGRSAFYGCIGLTNMIIPNSVSSIDWNAFYGCTGLTSITIPNSVISIGNYAFADCSGLISATIGNSVSSIGAGAFNGCSALATLNYNAISCADCSSLYNDTNISTINIGNSVQRIPANLAKGLANLTNLIIGRSVTSIGTKAFENDFSIESVVCKAITPPSWDEVAMFPTNVYNHSPLYVPIGSERAYMADQSWGQFITIIGIEMPDEVLATDISLNQSQMSLQVGGTSQLNATVLPESTTNKVVNWISSDENIVTVDTTGLVTALAVGSVTITATTTDGSNLSASCIVTVTEDLSDYDNYLSMVDTTVMHGETIVIPVKMTNEASIISFQTDIFLPEGLELMQEDGEYIIDPSSRMTRTHSIMSNDVSNGAIRVICYSSNYKPFTGNSGDDLFYLTVKVADDAEGDYTIQLKNTLLTNTDFVDLAAPDVAANVNVKAYILGDANNSGTVTVTDVVVTAQYVLELNPQPFIFEAADVNLDNNITVADVSRIAWMVLNPTLNAPLRAPALWNNGDCMSGSDITLATGETRRVSIMLDNEMDYAAFQLDLNLPAGLTASNFQLTDRAGSHAFDVNTLQNGNIRALCYSPDMTAINGHEGALLTFDVTSTGNVKGDITVDGIELVTTACQSVRLDAFAIGVNNATAVNEMTTGKTISRVEYFNLAGQQIEQPESGVTLVVTTYTDGTRSTTKLIQR